MTEPLTRGSLKGMDSGRIVEAMRAGELDHLLKPTPGGADQGARGKVGELTRGSLRFLSPAEIVAADRDGRLDHLLGRSR